VDATTEKLVAYALAAETDLRPAVRIAALQRVVDSVACAIAGYDTAPARVARRLARRVRADLPATVFGDGTPTAPELAAFANTVMVRALDWNDGMLARGGGHPSDMIPAVLAAGEVAHASGREVLAAIVLAYEVLGSLGSATGLRERGWDQGTFIAVASALAIGRLSGLGADDLANAVSLAIVPNVPLRVTRVGHLSMWKGCASAAAVRNALFAVSLASEGMTGPAEPFEGRSGLWDQVTGPFEFQLPVNPGGPSVVELSHLKPYPAESHSQALISLAPAIRAAVDPTDIRAIEVETYWHAFNEIGSDPAKWDPDTRETADHSLPYLLAVALLDGTVTPASFTPERLADPALRDLMAKIEVRENPEFTAQYRPTGREIAGSPRTRITVRGGTGAPFVAEVGFPKGHYRNPMSPGETDAKLEAACAPLVAPARREEIRAAFWSLDSLHDVGDAIRTLSSLAPPTTGDAVGVGDD